MFAVCGEQRACTAQLGEFEQSSRGAGKECRHAPRSLFAGLALSSGTVLAWGRARMWVGRAPLVCVRAHLCEAGRTLVLNGKTSTPTHLVP